MNFTKKLSHDESEDDYSYNDSNGSYIESEEDCEYQPNNKRTRRNTNASSSITNVSNGIARRSNLTSNGIQRRPTRVPDNRVSNRNALLARENRKRKKEMMDSLEQTVNDLQSENRKLQKMMKSKDARTLKMEQEIRYLKSVITNRTEIVSVLKSLPQFPVKKSCEKVQVKKDTSTGSGSETASCETFDDNGKALTIDPFLPTIIDDFPFPDFEVATEWDEILRNPFNSGTDFTDISKLDDVELLSPVSSPLSEISTEHNYYEKSSLMSNESGAGVCVHINSGRVSLEFCSTCHFNATNSWIDTN